MGRYRVLIFHFPRSVCFIILNLQTLLPSWLKPYRWAWGLEGMKLVLQPEAEDETSSQMGDGKIRVRIWPRVAQERPRGSLSLGLGVRVPGSWNWTQDKSSKQNESRKDWEPIGLFYLVPSVPVKCIKFQSQLQADGLKRYLSTFAGGTLTL